MKIEKFESFCEHTSKIKKMSVTNSKSRIPKLALDIPSKPRLPSLDNKKNKEYGMRRIPTPIPRIITTSDRGKNRMSRQTRAGPPPSAASTSGTTGATGGSGIPGQVVQQAQQYLEENIKRWMEPVPQPPNREEILPLPLENPTAPLDSQLSSHPRLPSTSSSSSIPSRQHVLTRAQQALISPSSGYSEYSDRDPFSGLSDEERAICEKAWRQASEAERVLKQREEAAWRQFPHSLSFGGCSQHSFMQGTSYSTPCGNSPFGITQPSAAASFFARASQRLNLSAKKKKKNPESSKFRTNFREIIKSHPPPVPPGLLRITGRKEVTGVGKVKVMLRMCPSNEADSSYISVDSRKKQVTLYDPTVCGQETSGDRHAAIAAPKMFAFDAVFSPDDNQAEVCSSSLCDVISSVVGGSDGCLFVYGHSKLGKTNTMIGGSNSTQEIGVIPSAIWWLFRAINEHKHRTGARFSVRVSALELCGKAEELRDLLADYAAGTEGSGAAPGAYLRDDQTIFGSYLTHQSELRAPSAERAAFLLDAALAARTAENEEDAKNSHFLFTLHVYQYRIEKGERGGVSGGRSRLHLFDLGSCEKTTKSRDGSAGGCLSLSALGNVILALFNGQKHVPYKDSKLTQLLREAMGSVMCRAAMIAHVSTNPSRYPETLSTLQLASRIHRLRRKKLKFAASGELGPVGDDKGVCRPFVRIHAVGEDGVVKSGGSDQDYTSSSEQSCDTVIFVGSGRGTPLPSNICDRKPTQPISPLAKETPSSSSGVGGSTPKKSVTKTHHTEKSSAATGTCNTGIQSSSKEQKTTEYVSKSALNEQLRNSSNFSPKKKLSSSSPYSSPKHCKTGDGEISKASPKMSKYVMMDYSDSKKYKNSGECSAKSSPVRMSKSTDVHSKPIPVSATSSPQTQRKSKRSHKQELSQQLFYQQQQAENVLKLLMKEPKPSSDETWIDGPRFAKPKFDSRTLHQLQKEKWVDGPGMYGYMDVQKETMIRKWVEDHSRIIPETESQKRKEVWIDFPPPKDERALHSIKNVSSSEKHSASPPVAEKVKKERTKMADVVTRELHMEAEKHYHNKSSKELPRQVEPLKELKEKDNKVKPTSHIPIPNDLDNSINGNLSELIGHSDNGSFESSSGSVDFNDNNSEDFDKEYQTLIEDNKSFSNSNLQIGDKDGCILLTDNTTNDLVMMTDSSIQVTEEDIFTTCGWPREMVMDIHHFSDTDSYEGTDHPLHVLSAEDLNLASSFTDSRAMSVDFDSLSVPEGWTPDSNAMDPDLTWKLLKGKSLPHHGSRTTHTKNINSTEDVTAKNNLLASKLEKLANLRQMIEKTSFNNQESWKQPLDTESLKRLCTSENRFQFVSKLHHSADSSLEELRENDVNSIRSEPAELDIENFEFHFNVKPMNGLRLEAFYNKIQKVPLFPDCFSQFGKPTQVVPPIIKQQSKLIKTASEDDALKNVISSKTGDKDNLDKSPSKLRHRWSTSSSKRSTPTKDIAKELQPETNEDTVKVQNSADSVPIFEKCSPNTTHDTIQTKAEVHAVPTDKKPQTLSEVVQEQRCRVYSESPLPNQVQFHSPKHSAQRTSKSKNTTEHSNHTNHSNKVSEVVEVRHDYFLVKQHQRKKGSPKFSPRGFLGSYRSNQKQKQHVQYSYPSVASANISDTVTVLSPGGSITSTYVSSPHVHTEVQMHGEKSQILIRSTSTPVSPFSNVPSEAILAGETYSYLTPAAAKKDSKWAARQSSSGHGSDSSVISADMKETKELLGKMGKTPQFSGTSSGYESMPRDSEGTPLSSSSQESGSEVGAKKEARGRKGTRKKTQGSSKRSRSVPARPPVTNSPTWQQQQQQQQQQSVAVSRQQLRGRLVRDLHDPTLWKSEEDVCCTSLLCCRLLDFY